MPQIVKSVMRSFVQTLEMPEGYRWWSLYGSNSLERAKASLLT